MKSFIVLAMCVAVAIAAPASPDADAQILRYDNDNIGLGDFQYAFENSNGIAASEQGQLVNAGTENEAVVVQGEYSYTGDDGVRYRVTYIADQNGFQPDAPHIPK